MAPSFHRSIEYFVRPLGSMGNLNNALRYKLSRPTQGHNRKSVDGDSVKLHRTEIERIQTNVVVVASSNIFGQTF